MRGDDVGAVAAIDPARYVIGPDGVIAYAEVDPNYTVRPGVRRSVPILDRSRAPAGA